jgi:hypothetical protein
MNKERARFQIIHRIDVALVLAIVVAAIITALPAAFSKTAYAQAIVNLNLFCQGNPATNRFQSIVVTFKALFGGPISFVMIMDYDRNFLFYVLTLFYFAI